MAEKEYLKLYKDPKYWNMDLRDEFMHETNNLWHKNMDDKYTGRIFQDRGKQDEAFELAMEKVDREMIDAVKKHGPVRLPECHIEGWYDRIDQEKANIVARS